MVNDSISDALTRIRNAMRVKHQIVKIPLTNMSLAIIRVLKQEGYIEEYEVCPVGDPYGAGIIILLRYSGVTREPSICRIERVSKPGLRVYVDYDNLPVVLNDLGIAIMSTSKGVITNIQAREEKVGGEVLCYVW